jgi:type II secretory pathway predicted ATPase ExeA
MYEKHFGLKSKPFGSKAEGSGVFVGPQQTKIIASLQKGLVAPDAVVTITGPAGVGKTTIVNRALESLPTGRTAAQIGRMHLSSQEVVDLLMGGFGIKQSHQGSIRRFAAFRRLLQAQSESGIPVAIVIEDAQRLGTDALAEVEALTAADAGDAASANIILMGQPGLYELLSKPDLARLRQRVRLRQKLASLSLAEVQGYLKHSIREAGGNYDTIFDSGIAEIVFSCSEGIPRIINTLCETALATAMEEHSARVTVALMRQVASDAFGYEETPGEVNTTPTAEEPARSEPEFSPRPVKETVSAEEDIDWEAPSRQEAEAQVATDDDDDRVGDESGIGHDIVVESGSYPGAAEILAAEKSQHAASDAFADTIDDTNLHEIPELINDTQPALPELQAPLPEEIDDIPVLRPDADDIGPDTRAVAEAEAAIESTQTLAHPTGISIDEAVPVATDAKSAESAADADDKSDEDFDLDAALSPEVDSTNVMPGITPNFDALASESRPIETEVPAKAQTPGPKPKAEPVSAAFPNQNDLPTLSNSMRVDVKKEVARAEKLEPSTPPASDATTNAPAMRDPFGLDDDADRASDIDAIEAALAAAKNGTLAAQNVMPAVPGVNGVEPGMTIAPQSQDIPEISLDRVIADQQIQNDELDRFRKEIGSASSLEDISDVMAETLFGCEAFDEIAADVVANPPKDHVPPAGEGAPSPVKLTVDEMPIAANDAVELSLEEAAPKETPVATTNPGDSVPLNESVALRIEMLNAMKSKAATMAENVELGEDNPAAHSSRSGGAQPEPIERQINTSMTQTLEALKLSKVATPAVTEKSEKKSGGLFSRFKKSS